MLAKSKTMRKIDPKYETAFRNYVTSLNHNLATGDATERTHRLTLMELIKSLQPGLTLIQEDVTTRLGRGEVRGYVCANAHLWDIRRTSVAQQCT